MRRWNVLDTLHMRESVPSLCVEIYQFPHPKAVDDFCFLFAYAGFYVPGTRKSDTCRRSVQGMSREHPGARRNYAGAADCCIATRAAARAFGLGFIPLVSERYDLAIRRQHLDLPGIVAMLDTLNRSSYRRELESLGGYDAKAAGERLL